MSYAPLSICRSVKWLTDCVVVSSAAIMTWELTKPSVVDLLTADPWTGLVWNQSLLIFELRFFPSACEFVYLVLRVFVSLDVYGKLDTVITINDGKYSVYGYLSLIGSSASSASSQTGFVLNADYAPPHTDNRQMCLNFCRIPSGFIYTAFCSRKCIFQNCWRPFVFDCEFTNF